MCFHCFLKKKTKTAKCPISTLIKQILSNGIELKESVKTEFNKMEIEKRGKKDRYVEKDLYVIVCTIRKVGFETQNGEWNEESLKRWLDEFMFEMKKNVNLRVQTIRHGRLMEEGIFEVDVTTTYNNPLHVISDINRMYPFLKIELQIRY